MSPKVVPVIISYDRRGAGIADDPVRIVTQVHDLNGGFIAEFDPVTNEVPEGSSWEAKNA